VGIVSVARCPQAGHVSVDVSIIQRIWHAQTAGQGTNSNSATADSAFGPRGIKTVRGWPMSPVQIADILGRKPTAERRGLRVGIPLGEWSQLDVRRRFYFCPIDDLKLWRHSFAEVRCQRCAHKVFMLMVPMTDHHLRLLVDLRPGILRDPYYQHPAILRRLSRCQTNLFMVGLFRVCPRTIVSSSACPQVRMT
jgi:hypothetical protein